MKKNVLAMSVVMSTGMGSAFATFALAMAGHSIDNCSVPNEPQSGNFEALLEGLQILDAISRRGSFAAAAEELFRVPPHHLRLSRSSKRTSASRFSRGTVARPRLTPAGEALLEEGRLCCSPPAISKRASSMSPKGMKRALRSRSIPFCRARRPLTSCASFTPDAARADRCAHRAPPARSPRRWLRIRPLDPWRGARRRAE